jgi:hypothetical protein
MRSAKLGIVLAAVAIVSLAACATQPDQSAVAEPGFWLGLIHGSIAPVVLIISFFKTDIRVYAFPNGGWWYDCGYVIGFSLAAGGGSRAA